MTLQSAIEAALPLLRTEAEARMTTRVNVWRRLEIASQDEETGEQEVDWAAVYVDHPFRLGGSERGGSGTRTITTGGVELQLATRVGNFPASTDDLMDDDLIEILSGENIDAVYRIVEADFADQQTARRVPVVAEPRPEEWL